jgi:hypothetical protein
MLHLPSVMSPMPLLWRFITDIDKFYRFGQYSEPHKKYAMVVKFVNPICTPNALFLFFFIIKCLFCKLYSQTNNQKISGVHVIVITCLCLHGLRWPAYFMLHLGPPPMLLFLFPCLARSPLAPFHPLPPPLPVPVTCTEDFFHKQVCGLFPYILFWFCLRSVVPGFPAVCRL